jgi:hypothetical protein
MEGVVIFHEIMHEMHRKNESGIILKIDFEKVYDKVKWSFIKHTLLMKGFSQTWCKWIEAFTQNGHARIKINDQISDYFVTKKAYDRETRYPRFYSTL